MGDVYYYAVLKEEGGGGRRRDQNIPFPLPLLQLYRSWGGGAWPPPNVNINAYYVSPTNMCFPVRAANATHCAFKSPEPSALFAF